MEASEIQREQLNDEDNHFVGLERQSCDVDCKFDDELFEIDKKLLIDPSQLFVGPKIGEGAHGKVYKGR